MEGSVILPLWFLLGRMEISISVVFSTELSSVIMGSILTREMSSSWCSHLLLGGVCWMVRISKGFGGGAAG